MNIKKYFLQTTFKDNRNNMVYFDNLSDTAYKIPKDVESMFKLFLGRGLYAIIIFLFLNSSGYDALVSIIIPLALYLGMSYYFYQKLLPKYDIVKKFDISEAREKDKSRGRNMRYLMILLYIISIVVIVYLAFERQETTFTIATVLYVTYAIFKLLQSYFTMFD